jgi:prepilin peptidase CpaA
MIETLIFALFAILMITAGIGDCLTMKIPNWLNGVIGISFFGAAFAVGMPIEQIGWHLATAAVVLVLGFGLFAAGCIGGGDAKLLAVAALWLGSGQLIEFLVVMALAGGALAIIMKFWWWIKLEMELRGLDQEKSRVKTSIDLPYGIAIAVGALFAFRHSWWLEAPNLQLLG